MKEKQIEEMAHEIFENFNCRVREEEAERIAKHLVVNAGYRKQIEGEWNFHKDGNGTCSQCGTTQKKRVGYGQLSVVLWPLRRKNERRIKNA